MGREVRIVPHVAPEIVDLGQLLVGLSLPAPQVVLAQPGLGARFETQRLADRPGGVCRTLERADVERRHVPVVLSDVPRHAPRLRVTALRERGIDRSVPDAVLVGGRLAMPNEHEDGLGHRAQ